jgi:hypothetical protein
MTDNWEDWEADNYTLPVFNKEQLKRLEEQKLVEESDNALVSYLFSNEEQILLDEELNKNSVKPKSPLKAEKIGSKKLIANRQLENEKRQLENEKRQLENEKRQLENEKRQKEISKKNKEEKIRKQKAIELYGEAEEDLKFQEYEDMFY